VALELIVSATDAVQAALALTQERLSVARPLVESFLAAHRRNVPPEPLHMPETVSSLLVLDGQEGVAAGDEAVEAAENLAPLNGGPEVGSASASRPGSVAAAGGAAGCKPSYSIAIQKPETRTLDAQKAGSNLGSKPGSIGPSKTVSKVESLAASRAESRAESRVASRPISTAGVAAEGAAAFGAGAAEGGTGSAQQAKQA
jgi:hypothetical protein